MVSQVVWQFLCGPLWAVYLLCVLCGFCIWLSATAATTGAGTVVSINVAEQYVVLDSGVAGEDGVTETAIYYFNEGVKIVKGGQEVTTSDLTEGDKVSIEYSTDEDDNKVINTLTVE